MESYIIGLFSEQLATYIHGFKKEQVNASLLSGKGEISEVHVNVDPINEILQEFIPYFKLASMFVSKVSFNVTSIRNIKNSPIEISVDEVHIVLVERLKLTGPTGQIWIDTAKKYIEKAKKSGSYGLIERIRDNITIDVNRIYVTFQPMGKLKTRKIGPWTPPALSVVLNNFRAVTVDEYGEEGTPDDVWRHNSRVGRQENIIRNKNNDSNIKRQRTFRSKTHMVFKKVSFDMSIGIGSRKKGMSAKETFLSSHLLFVNLPVQSHLAMHRRISDNALLALQADLALTNLELVIESETLPLLVHALVGLQYCFMKDRSFDDPMPERETDESLLLISQAGPSFRFENDKFDIKEGDESKAESDDVSEFNTDSDDEDIDSELNSDVKNNSPAVSPQTINNNNDNDNDQTSVEDSEDWPAFVLPSGIIVVEKLCVSLSIHSFSIRAKYNSSVNGYLQFTMKGLVAEIIWPRLEGQQKGFIQLSLSHLNFHEFYDNKIRMIFNGGNRIEEDIYEDKEITNDESFPSMELRDVRSDPIDLTTSFPIQAFGFKASIAILDQEKILTFKSRLSVLNEIGMNSIEVAVYPEVLDRATELFWKYAQNKFEYRWFSGEWEDELPANISIDIEQCIQPLSEAITKEFELSSELVNVTMKVSDLTLKIPAPMIDLRRSSDVIINFAEITMDIASSLPRIFLSEDIFGSDNEEKSSIPESESNVRMQTTMNGLSLEVIPSPLFRSAKESQRVFFSKAMTFLGSYDRLKEGVNGSNCLCLSVLLHDVYLNIDFDVLACAAATLLHYATYYETANDEKKTLDSQQAKTYIVSKMPESLTLIMRIDLSKIEYRLWRQHVPVTGSQTAIPVMPLLHFALDRIELGIKIIEIDLSRLFVVSKNLFEYDKVIGARIGNLQLSTFETLKSTGKSAKEDGRSDVILPLEFKAAEIISFGNENECGALEFHLFSNGGASQCYTITIDLKSFTLRVGDDLENAIIMIVEAALSPEWFWSSQLFMIDPDSKTRNNHKNETDTPLEKMVSILSTESTVIESVVIRVKMQNIGIILPLQNVEEALSMICESAQLNIGYLKGGVSHTCEKDWLIIFRDCTEGFHHNLSSRQRLSLLKQKEVDKQITMESDDIIKSFEFESYLHPLNLEGSLTQCTLSTKELITLDHAINSFNNYRDRFVKLYLGMSKAFASFYRDNKVVEKEKLEAANASNGPLSIACHTSTVSIESASKILEEVNELLSSLKDKIGCSFTAKNTELAEMRSKFFLKEKDRFSAFALLTNEASGYIRVGSTSLGQQRIVSTTNFWRYWAVLKKNTIILFSNPSDAIPVDYLKLEGAKLVALIGGGTKRRDLKKGFAIIDSNGKKRFFISETYAQYEKWVYAISNSMHPKKNSLEFLPKEDSGKGEEDLNESEHVSGFNEEITEDLGFLDHISIPNVQSSISEDGISTDASNEDAEGAKKLNLREKAKNRMSQIGTAVKKNVKIDKNAIRQLNTGTFQKIARIPNTGYSSRSSEPPALKVRGLKHSTDEPEIKEQIIHRDQEMSTVIGSWIARISSTENNNDDDEISVPSKIKIDIHIQCLQWKEDGNGKPSDIIITRSISELLKFHAEISGALISIRRDLKAAGLILTSEDTKNMLFAQVLHCGRLFKGLLQYHDQENNIHLINSVCETLENFINALLSNPLPTFPYNVFVNFLGMQHLMSDPIGSSVDEERPKSLSDDKFPEYESEFATIVSLVQSCKGAISQAKRQSTLANTLASKAFRLSTISKKQVTYPPSSNKYSVALHEALMVVMAQRDEAQSQLLAERVFHTHELDQERRKVEMLQKKIVYLEKLNNEDTASAAAFFLGQEEIPTKDTWGKIEQTMVQNVDVELMELCRQLSGEISMRVSSELEILRLKESRTIERETESVERTMLDDQAKYYKEKLEEVEAERDAAMRESGEWKKSFEEVITIDQNDQH